MTDVQILCLNPVVAVADGVFDAETAEAAIAAGRDNLVRAGVVGLGGRIENEARTNRQALIDQWASPILTDLCTRVSALVRIPPENCEPAKLLHYEGDQKFDVHLDAYDGILPGSVEPLRYGGQRLFTTLCYLNDVDDGGETEFPRLSISVRARRGRVLIFGNTIPGTDLPHPHAVHAGRSVASGEKWVLSLWWRERVYHVPREYPDEEGSLRRI